jgi:hypothetical protein
MAVSGERLGLHAQSRFQHGQKHPAHLKNRIFVFHLSHLV